MTRPDALSQADIARVIRAADACGKVAFVTKAGIALVDPASLPLPSPNTFTVDADLIKWGAK